MARGFDVLDVVTGTVVAAISATAWATYKGYGVPAVSTLITLCSAAYLSAPRRSWPTAGQVVSGQVGEECVAGKVAIVTGATSGIGIDTAGALYQSGAIVYIAARNPQKLESAKETIISKYASTSQGEIRLLQCDLDDLDSVKRCAETFCKDNKHLHILINNAGIMALPERQPTKQGLERQIGVCHVAHFYLTQLLIPKLAKDARVVYLSSSAHRRHKINAMLQSPLLETQPYDPWVAYGNAKCSNLLMAKALSERGILAYAVMPGGIHTGLQLHVDWWTMLKWTLVTPLFFKSTEQGAATSIVCATTADPADSGKYFDNCQPTNAVAKVEEEAGGTVAAKLWTQTEELLKIIGY